MRRFRHILGAAIAIAFLAGVWAHVPASTLALILLLVFGPRTARLLGRV